MVQLSQNGELVPVYRHLPFLAVNALELYQFLSGENFGQYSTWVAQGLRKSRSEEGRGHLLVPEGNKVCMYLSIPVAQIFNRCLKTEKFEIISNFFRILNTQAQTHTAQAIQKVEPQTGMPALFEKDGVQAVSARDLCEKLGLDLTHWSRWYKKNILDNQFAIEGEDYFSLATMASERKPGNYAQDFALSIDFAKRVAMMTRTEQGEKIRRYFIDCEKAAKAMASFQRNTPQISALEARIKALEAQTAPIKYFSISEYAKAQGIKLKSSDSSRFGQLAVQMCKSRGIQTGEMPHGKIGKIKTYPISVLEAIFDK
jgi:phage anti-repressor protein